jgi:superfamily II DNA/RNA helicase
MSFEYLGLSDNLLAAIKDAGYTKPTPIQAAAIPNTLQGRDVLGIAQTGTGKTASFTLPMIDILSEGRARARMPRSLILEPTRELAAQVAESFEKYGKNTKLTMALLIGGVAFSDQEKLLDRGVDVLIATPGRLMDHMSRGKVMLNGVEILVVDEADRMLDMGFIPDVEKICKAMPPKLQKLFFSATMPKEVKRLTDSFLNDPKEITVSAPTSTASTIRQFLVNVAPSDKVKREVLRHLIKSNDVTNGIIFCNRKKDVKIVAKSLKIHGFNADELHGDLHQNTRTEILQKFKAGDIQLLVASDVAARGLDIPDVSHIFNFEVPNNPEDYVHRIGRTGRAGKKGTAFLIASSREKKNLALLLKFLGKKIDVLELKDFETTPKKPTGSHKSAERSQKPTASSNKSSEDSNKSSDKKHVHDKNRSNNNNKVKTDSASSNQKQNIKKPSPKKPTHDNKHKTVIGMGDHIPAFLLRNS